MEDVPMSGMGMASSMRCREWTLELRRGSWAAAVALLLASPSIADVPSWLVSPRTPLTPTAAATPAAAKQGAKPAPSTAPARRSPNPESRKRDAAALVWNRARLLADQGRYEEALVAIQAGLIESPDNTELLWLEAGVYGWSGRHDESIARFERLMTEHPEMAKSLRKDLAEQRLAAGDAAGALRDIQLSLSEQPGDRDARRLRATALSNLNRLPESLAAYDSLLLENPEDMETASERARVLGWMGHHREAIAAYDAILQREPRDVNARMGVATNENWSGNHRKAAEHFQALLDDGVPDPEVLKGLATAEYGAGRIDRAQAALDRYRAERPNDPEGAELARALRGETGGYVTAGYQRSDDSDALRIGTSTLEVGWQVNPRTTLQVHVRRDDVRDGGGDRDPLWVGAGFERAWSEQWATQGSIDWVRTDPGAEGVGAGELNVTFRPVQRLRFDAGVARQPVLTRLALANDIFVRVVTLGADWQTTERLVLHADERLRYFSDDNRSMTTTGWLRWLVATSRRADFFLRFSAVHLHAKDDLDHGYYDPDEYVEAGPGAQLEWRPQNGWTVGLEGTVGMQRENDADQEPFHSFLARLGIPLGDAAALNIEGGRSNSNLSSESGFRQKRWSAYVTTRF